MTLSHSGLPVSVMATPLDPSLIFLLPPKCRYVQNVCLLLPPLPSLWLCLVHWIWKGLQTVGCWKQNIQG